MAQVSAVVAAAITGCGILVSPLQSVAQENMTPPAVIGVVSAEPASLESTVQAALQQAAPCALRVKVMTAAAARTP